MANDIAILLHIKEREDAMLLNAKQVGDLREEAVALMEKLDAHEDGTVHGPEHILAVEKLALRFAKESGEPFDESLVSAIALLHDVDDYKLTGGSTDNARDLLTAVGVPDWAIDLVSRETKCLGYSKRRSGKRLETKEAAFVSDADMCEAMGATGIVRLAQHATVRKEPFFDRTLWPRENLSVEEYRRQYAASSVNHMFEKCLWLTEYMLTEPGKKEADTRQAGMISFLKMLFREQQTYDWMKYLEDQLEVHGMSL